MIIVWSPLPFPLLPHRTSENKDVHRKNLPTTTLSTDNHYYHFGVCIHLDITSTSIFYKNVSRVYSFVSEFFT